jgi:hypothetical protein
VTPIRISFLWRQVLPDPGDDLVLDTAVNGAADVLVTFNRRHFEPAASRFGLEILVPADAVRRPRIGHEEEPFPPPVHEVCPAASIVRLASPRNAPLRLRISGRLARRDLLGAGKYQRDSSIRLGASNRMACSPLVLRLHAERRQREARSIPLLGHHRAGCIAHQVRSSRRR